MSKDIWHENWDQTTNPPELQPPHLVPEEFLMVHCRKFGSTLVGCLKQVIPYGKFLLNTRFIFQPWLFLCENHFLIWSHVNCKCSSKLWNGETITAFTFDISVWRFPNIQTTFGPEEGFHEPWRAWIILSDVIIGNGDEEVQREHLSILAQLM